MIQFQQKASSKLPFSVFPGYREGIRPRKNIYPFFPESLGAWSKRVIHKSGDNFSLTHSLSPHGGRWQGIWQGKLCPEEPTLSLPSPWPSGASGTSCPCAQSLFPCMQLVWFCFVLLALYKAHSCAHDVYLPFSKGSRGQKREKTWANRWPCVSSPILIHNTFLKTISQNGPAFLHILYFALEGMTLKTEQTAYGKFSLVQFLFHSSRFTLV